MQIVITSRKAATLDTWRRARVAGPEVTFHLGWRSAMPVDAMVVAGVHAFPRLGGRPRWDRAQIIENTHYDAWPKFLVVPPTRPMVLGEDGVARIHPDFRRITPASYAASEAIAEIVRWNETQDDAISAAEVNLPLLEFDNPADASSARAFQTALRDRLTAETVPADLTGRYR
ncbi:hypothetical protein [Streptomyces sp. NBRC 109706]|uniref:hypothetical protein n=1 Tax=Streptomyces sp. NBRC 109706 TaxID=1550035 RepID=UPI000781ADF8|nr:hypothetical protein [Streptomyces sp. NBRC 109706]